MQVYEVFRREREGGPMQHAGNLLAPDPELASHYAREFYGRRQESVRLWIVPRSAERLELRRLNYAETQWVRDTVLAPPVAA